MNKVYVHATTQKFKKVVVDVVSTKWMDIYVHL